MRTLTSMALVALVSFPFYVQAAGEADAAKGESASSPSMDTAPPASSSTAPARTHHMHKPDSAITASVKTKLLASPDTSGMKIHVSTKNGVVTLSGKAQSEQEKESADGIAKGVRGVRSVKNQLTVGG